MPLLCRVAENMFWLSRYVERAIAVIRVVDVTAHLELDAGDAESRGIQQRYGTPMAQLAYLAETKRIQPLTTQGSITDLDVRRIVYDARTAEGGSGAPLFGPSGRVIGVNFAVFTENQASNFAVPSRFAISLLERTGWKAPPKEGKELDTAVQPSSFTP